MKKSVTTLVIFVLVFLPTIALAGKLVFATASQPPYVISEKGQLPGMDIEIVRELCKRLGFESEIRLLPWTRALNYTEKGTADAVFSPRRTAEREKFLYYSSEPLHIERTVILAPKGTGLKLNKIDELKNKVVGVVRGYAYVPIFDDYQGLKKKVECDDDEQLVTIFAKKRVELVAASDEGTMKYLCKKAAFQAEVVYVLDEVPTYIGFSKALGEKGKALADKFSEALKKLKEEGFIEKVQSKYF